MVSLFHHIFNRGVWGHSSSFSRIFRNVLVRILQFNAKSIHIWYVFKGCPLGLQKNISACLYQTYRLYLCQSAQRFQNETAKYKIPSCWLWEFIRLLKIKKKVIMHLALMVQRLEIGNWRKSIISLSSTWPNSLYMIMPSPNGWLQQIRENMVVKIKCKMQNMTNKFWFMVLILVK